MVNFKKVFFPVMLISLIYLVITKKIENFNPVPFNSFNIPKEENENITWTSEQKMFNKLIQIVNSKTYEEPYNLQDNTLILEKILNDAKIGQFKILSIENNKSFIMQGVLIQNIETFALKRLSKVTLEVSSFSIKQVIISDDPTFDSSLFLTPLDKLQPSEQFRIKNPLHLFAPYDTSDNENEISKFDFVFLQNIVSEKYDQYKQLN